MNLMHFRTRQPSRRSCRACENSAKTRPHISRPRSSPDPAAHLREGGVIKPGFDAELDRLQSIGTTSQQWLVEFQSRLSTESAIPTLKVGFNKVFGYYIEVTDSHRSKIPAAWSRKQTVKNAERYITEELKQFESDALSARDRAIALEQTLFENIRQTLLPNLAEFQELAYSIARTDVLASSGDAGDGSPLVPADDCRRARTEYC